MGWFNRVDEVSVDAAFYNVAQNIDIRRTVSDNCVILMELFWIKYAKDFVCVFFG